MADTECCICLTSIPSDPALVATLPCGHRNCKSCIAQWQRFAPREQRCPQCRAPLPTGAPQLCVQALTAFIRADNAGWRGAEARAAYELTLENASKALELDPTFARAHEVRDIHTHTHTHAHTPAHTGGQRHARSTHRT